MTILPLRLRLRLFRIDVRHQVSDGLFPSPGAFDNLWKEHLAGAEQIADDAHRVHQRPFDDVERRLAASRASSVSGMTNVLMP
jgi:hypothetical protein